MGGAFHHGSQNTWSVQSSIIEFNRFMISSHEQNEGSSVASSLLSASDVQVLEEWRSQNSFKAEKAREETKCQLGRYGEL
jgi:hypothetical protein